MKKIYLIILVFVLVLGLSVMADAASFDVSGTMEIGGVFFGGDWFLVYAIGGEAAFSQAFGDAASISMTLSLDTKNVLQPIGFFADFMYNVSPTFRLAVIYDSSGIIYFSGPVFSYWSFGENLAVVAIDAFDGGSVIGLAGVQAPFNFGLAGNYSTGPLTVGGFFKYETMDAGAYLTYMATDNLSLSGEVWYDGGPAYFGGNLAYTNDIFAFNAEYDTLDADINLDGSVVVIPELLMVKGFLSYNIAILEVDSAGMEAGVAFGQALTGYASYEYYLGDADYISAGLSWKFGQAKTLNADIYDITGDEAMLSLVLEITF